jgi:hypothetical protein
LVHHSHFDEPPTAAMHTGVVGTPGTVTGRSPANIIEALWRVREHPLAKEYGGTTTRVMAARRLDLAHGQRLAIADIAREYVGRPYGGLKLLTIAADQVLGGFGLWGHFRVFRRLNVSRFPICSSLVEDAYLRALGRSLTGQQPGASSPDDICDWIEQHLDVSQAPLRSGPTRVRRIVPAAERPGPEVWKIILPWTLLPEVTP